MVAVPAGKFMMGSSASEEYHSSTESPLHEVTVAKSFLVGKPR
jgi:formylglycine-generating enzyme required for sulfatase activity